MSISTDVNLDVLNECFELVPFNGLRKPHPDDITQPPPTPPATPLAPPADSVDPETLSQQVSIHYSATCHDSLVSLHIHCSNWLLPTKNRQLVQFFAPCSSLFKGEIMYEPIPLVGAH